MSEPLCLGLEIGGTKLQLGLGHGDGRLLARERLAVDVAAGAAGIRAQIARSLGPLCERAGQSPAAIQAVGIGFGGPVDAARGVVTRSMQIEGWEEFPLAEWIGSMVGVRAVALQNDADTAGLAEARFGAGAGLSPVLYITLGSGIGGGLIIDGQIYRGSGAGAAEIGHVWVVPTGEGGSAPVQLEDMASGWALARAAKAALQRPSACREAPAWFARFAQSDFDRVTGAMVADAAHQGDPLALGIVAQARKGFAQALGQAITLLAPRRVILGGGVAQMPAHLWLNPLREELDAWVFAPFRPTFDLANAQLGEAVVVHGALALAHDALA